MMESITWIERRGQIKHLLYELCLTERIDRATLVEQFKDLNSVAPVKHGRWIDGWICSNCKEAFRTNGESWNYCPNCGARMDEVEE